MLKPDYQKRRYGMDLLSLPRGEWNKPETADAIRQLAASLVAKGPDVELTVVAPQFTADELAPHFKSLRATAYFLPLPTPMLARVYVQQTLLPLLFRWRNVNEVISFGQGVPVIYPATKLLALLPGQAKEWWKLMPALVTADVVSVDTAAQKVSLESRLPKIKSQIEVIPPAVGDEYHPYPKDAARELLEKYGIKSRYFLYLGPTSATSPCMVLLEAFAKIAHRPRLKSVQCVLAGSRDISVSVLRKRIEDLGLGHRVLITGELPASELPLWLSNAQFAVCADAGDDAPATLLRALAAGCPTIVPATRLFDVNLKSAVLQCHASDPKSLAEAMTKIIAEPEMRDALVKEGLELMANQSWQKRADAIAKIFDRRQRGLEGSVLVSS